MATLRDRIKDKIRECNRVGKYGTQDFNAGEALTKIMEEINKGRPLMPVAIDWVRPVIDWYAKRMEKRLKAKDAVQGKDGWHDGNLSYYLAKTAGCVSLISDIIRVKTNKNKEIHETGIHLAIKKCIDGGNYFMMLADNMRDELIRRGEKNEKDTDTIQKKL